MAKNTHVDAMALVQVYMSLQTMIDRIDGIAADLKKIKDEFANLDDKDIDPTSKEECAVFLNAIAGTGDVVMTKYHNLSKVINTVIGSANDVRTKASNAQQAVNESVEQTKNKLSSR